MESIVLIGGGGHCRSCIDVIECEGKYKIEGIIDVEEKIGSKVLDYKVIGADRDIPEIIKEFRNCLITIGQIKTPDLRIKFFTEILKEGGKFPYIISPLSHVSRHASLGQGTIIMHHSIINAGAKVGANSIINTKALIEHDAHIGDNCHISTGAIVNGGVIVGECTFIGSGAVTKQNISILPYSFIKANSIVK